MKRTNIYISLVALLGIFMLGACNDFLDQPVKGTQELGNYYSNEDECLKALSGCYASLSPEDWWENDFFYLVGDICSDDAFKGNSIEGDQRDFGELARFNITPQNEWIEIKWRYAFEQVYRTNLVIANVPNAPVSEELKELIVAEAHFLRAFAYFELVKNWGGVPKITEPLSVNDPKQKRATESEIWELIESDLKMAIQFLPEKSDQSASALGRATKGAAKAYLVKAYVYQEKWSEAKVLAEDIVVSDEYNLNDPFNRIWNVQNPNGSGSIFEIQNNYHELYDAGNALPSVTGSREDGGWGFCTPSSHLDNFMGSDPRRNSTIIKHGDYVDEDHPSFDTSLSNNESGRTNRKYYLGLNERAPQEEHKRAPLNHILMRYADLLLLHAEAAWHVSDYTGAQNSVNMVRARVGLPSISSTGDQLLIDIYNERRMELAMEGHRYYDLKRQRGVEQPEFYRIKEVMEEFVDYNMGSNTDYDAGNTKGVLFDVNIHTLFPIPQTEIDLSEGALVQNPNY